MTRRISCVQWIIVGHLTILASCATTPEKTVDAMKPIGPAVLNDETAQAEHASRFWKRYNVPDMRPHNYKRVAIAEFVVEFVTRKVETNKSLSLEYSSYLMNSLPNSLLKLFKKDLESHGLEVLPTEKVRFSRAFTRFETDRNGMTPELDGAYHAASDTGRVKELTLYSAKDLLIVKGAGDADIEAVELEMLEELGVDVVLRVRIRVGVFGGHPSLERGSTVWVRSPVVAGNLTSDRSLISNMNVVGEEKDRFGSGVTLDIKVPRYDRGIREMFPAFLSMAHLSADSTPAIPTEQ